MVRDRNVRADRPLCSSPNMDGCNALQVPAAGVGASGPSQSDGRWNISHEDASFTGSTVRAESIPLGSSPRLRHAGFGPERGSCASW